MPDGVPDLTLEDPKDGENRIPHTRVKEMVDKARDEGKSELQGELETLRLQNSTLQAQIELGKRREPGPTPPPRGPGLTQLRKAVDDGEITQDQMDVELERQRQTSVRHEMDQRDLKLKAEILSDNEAEAKFADYVDVYPDIQTEGSANREKVRAKYVDLLRRGHTEGKGTQLLAMEVCFGEVSKVREKTAETRDTHAETGGPGGSPGEGEQNGEEDSAKAAAAKKLSSVQMAHFQDLIGKGRYTGWDDEKLLSVVNNYSGGRRARKTRQEQGDT
jgi:hypothetical protein